MMEAIVESLTKTLNSQRRVSIWVQICWEKCEQTRSYIFSRRLGNIPWSWHLDWVPHCGSWQSSSEPEGGGPLGGGFDVNDAAGISGAIIPSVLGSHRKSSPVV